MRTKRAAIIGIAVLTALLGAAACSSSSESSTAGDAAALSQYAAAPTMPEAAGDSDANAEAEVPSPGGVQGTQAPAAGENGSAGNSGTDINAALANRQVIKTATVQVELTIPIDTVTEKVEDVKRDTVAGATANLSAQATVLGGFVGSLDQSGASATLVLRVPVDKYDALLKAVGTVGGEVTNINEAAQDVTAQVTDIESRIKSQETSVERIRALLAEATNLEDIIRLESELSTREADLESWQGQLAVLSDQVGLSTISVSFTAVKDYVPSEKPAERSGFSGGLANGWDAFTNLLGGLATLVGTLLPFIPFFLLVIGGVWFWRRRSQARRPVPALAGAGGPSPYYSPAPYGAYVGQPAAPATGPAGPTATGPSATGPSAPAGRSAAGPTTGSAAGSATGSAAATTPPIPPTGSGTAESQQ